MTEPASTRFPLLPLTRRLLTACVAASAFALGTPASAGDFPATSPVAVRAPALVAGRLATAPMELRSYYAYYGQQPLWIASDGRLDPAAHVLLRLVETSDYDELSPATLNVDSLRAAISRAETAPSPEALTDAEIMLSTTLVAYQRALLEGTGSGMSYEHANLRPFIPSGQAMLRTAATSASLADYVSQMQWMHPLYAQLRETLIGADAAPTVPRAAIVKNLERLRAIPRAPGARYVLVDAANARLYMYEGDKVVDSMKVVVGKKETQTPMLAGYIRYAIFNPYWNVPTDLVGKRIVPSAIRQGQPYLKRQGYQVVSDWGDDATVLNSAAVDWKAVQRGEKEVKIRQLPGGANAMGKVKFEFPNPQGIYLHDTPERELLTKDARQFSNGCIRLEDAQRLGKWLLGGAMPQLTTAPEQRVDLAQPVPVYLTYLTARPEGTQIALTADPYGRDAVSGTALAQAN